MLITRSLFFNKFNVSVRRTKAYPDETIHFAGKELIISGNLKTKKGKIRVKYCDQTDLPMGYADANNPSQVMDREGESDERLTESPMTNACVNWFSKSKFSEE
jgi:hypothetical protein